MKVEAKASKRGVRWHMCNNEQCGAKHQLKADAPCTTCKDGVLRTIPMYKKPGCPDEEDTMIFRNYTLYSTWCERVNLRPFPVRQLGEGAFPATAKKNWWK